MRFSRKYPVGTSFIFNDVFNGNMKLEHFIELGKSVPPDVLVQHLNTVNNQGIESVDLTRRVYRREGKELSIYKLSTGERIFLIATIAAYTDTSVCFGRVLEQLSKEVLDRFLSAYNAYNSIEVFDPIGYYEARWNSRHD